MHPARVPQRPRLWRLSSTLTAQAHDDAGSIGGDLNCKLNAVLQVLVVKAACREPPEASLSLRRMEVRRVVESEVAWRYLSERFFEGCD